MPHYDIINNVDTVSRAKIAINNLMYDDTGFSCSASAKNIMDLQDEGWRFAIDSIAVSILQGNFRDTGFKGKLGFPLLKKKVEGDSSKLEYSYLTYQANH